MDGFAPGTIGTIGTLAGRKQVSRRRPPWVEDYKLNRDGLSTRACEGLREPGCRCITPFNAKNLGIISLGVERKHKKDWGNEVVKAATFSCFPLSSFGPGPAKPVFATQAFRIPTAIFSHLSLPVLLSDRPAIYANLHSGIIIRSPLRGLHHCWMVMTDYD